MAIFAALTPSARAADTSYHYDALGRLDQVTYANGMTVVYTYDAAGNRTTAVGTTKPIASGVTVTITKDSSSNPITLSLSGGTPTSVAVSTGASHGTASALGTSISYTPTGGYTGPDSFDYTATNLAGTSDPATVTITVVGPPITSNSFSYVMAYSGGTSIPLSLSGGTPTSVTVTSGASHGTASASGTAISYTPTYGYIGTDSFQYTATNAGGTSSAATVSLGVQYTLSPSTEFYSSYDCGYWGPPDYEVPPDLEGDPAWWFWEDDWHNEPPPSWACNDNTQYETTPTYRYQMSSAHTLGVATIYQNNGNSSSAYVEYYASGSWHTVTTIPAGVETDVDFGQVSSAEIRVRDSNDWLSAYALVRGW